MKRNRLYKICIVTLVLVLLAETGWITKEVQGRTADQEEWDYAIDTELSSHFDAALSDGSIEVWFQPIVDTDSMETVGAEALSRWRDGSEFISPSVFVSVLEETGQIIELDKNVFSQACLFQKSRIAAGAKVFPISVNLSVATLMREDIVEDYIRILTSEGLDAGLVNIEVTESLDNDKAQLVKVVEAFQTAGFQVEIDDFGAGYAALGNLAVIPYDVLKIDKSLVDEIGSERGDTLITDVIQMAKDFDMKIIAEGVEVQEQAEFLRDAGCDAIQEYYFAKPMPKEEFMEYLSEEDN